jgi:hypothetical protein
VGSAEWRADELVIGVPDRRNDEGQFTACLGSGEKAFELRATTTVEDAGINRRSAIARFHAEPARFETVLLPVNRATRKSRGSRAPPRRRWVAGLVRRNCAAWRLVTDVHGDDARTLGLRISHTVTVVDDASNKRCPRGSRSARSGHRDIGVMADWHRSAAGAYSGSTDVRSVAWSRRS